MSREEVGVEVGEEDVADLQPVLRRIVEVGVDVALRIDDGGGAARLIADQVRRVGEAIQVVLLEDHGCSRRLLRPADVLRPVGDDLDRRLRDARLLDEEKPAVGSHVI